MTDEFQFIRPLEAPVFSPSAAEFKDPLNYINKIRPIAEKAGICKVRPPPNWQPPFAVDVDSFKFTPRVQRLNELEAKTRIKLNFLDQIAKFWELQGSRLKIPIIDKKALDLYSLHKLVQAEGGKDKVNNEKKWNRLSTRMGYCQSKNYGSVLKAHYEKLLYPFDVFQDSKDKLIEKEKGPVIEKDMPKKAASVKTAPLKMGGGRMAPKAMKKTKSAAELLEDEGSSVIENTSKELRRLAFYGAGPKMAGFNVKSSQNLQLLDAKQRNQKAQAVQDPLAKYMCQVCDRGDVEASMLLCDGCDDSYHTFCLQPPLMEVPKGDWRCPRCLAEEVSKPGEAFGFEQAQREYTLQQFGEMADQFKSEYFNMPVHLVPSELVEKEFWRIVSAIDEDVTVEYGADLHSMDHGSGFPTEGSSNVQTGDEPYIKSGWNLNNLPVLPGSVLGYINADISGMKVPWMYVGMCFATFCWHNEDHWSYSINYLHWGEAKTWYGVPGSRADDFEDAMKQAAPELFHSQPDLLHQLVTIMNPNILMKAGVPVYRMDQKAGEFIITFPRAYHAGFNQGYNFAEAVNFAPADWLAMGRNCIEHYSTLHRYCVFSHDELVCKMSSESSNLDLIIAMATQQDIHKMFESEKEHRRVVLNWGVKQCERAPFEVLPDDERICDFCKTTCFLSAVSCPCTTNRLVCLKHYDKLCECPPASHILKYRFTLDELPVMIEKIHERTKDYEKWVSTMKSGLTYGVEDKMELETLRELLKEAEDKTFPKTPLLDSAIGYLTEAEKCSEVAQKLAVPMIRTRLRTDDTKFRLNLNELAIFADQLESLPVRLKESSTIRLLLRNITDFKNKAKELLKELNPKIDDLKACLNQGLAMEIELPEVALVQSCLDRRKWLEQVEAIDDSDTLWTVDYLTKCIEAGDRLDRNPEVEKRLKSLKELSCTLNAWEDKAKAMINPVKKNKIEDLEELLEEAKEINIALPSLPTIRDMIRKTSDWIHKVETLRKETPFPFLDELENITTKGDHIQVIIKELHVINSQINGAKLWKERCTKAFLKKNTTITLLEALIPRREINDVPSRGRKKRWSMETTSIQQMALLLELKVKDVKSAGVLAKSFANMQANELTRIREVRIANLAKRSADSGEGRYCVCQAPINNGFMIRCEICYEWFHATCVPLSKLDAEPVPGVSSHTMTVHKIASGHMKYFCPCCGRSRRPKLDIVLQLLLSLQQLPVRLPESEALHCLAERAVNWLDGARVLLGRPDIKAALQFIENPSPSTSSAPVTCPETSTSQAQGAGSPKKSFTKVTSSGPGVSSSATIHEKDSVSLDESDVSELRGEPLSSEHTYSANMSPARNGHQRKANLSPSKSPHGILPARLSTSTLTEIEETVLKGDLMEVGFEESDRLWRILQTIKPKPVVPNILDLQKMIEEEILRKNLAPVKPKKPGPGPGPKRNSEPNTPKRTRRASGQNEERKKRMSGETSPKRRRKVSESEVPAERERRERKNESSNQEYEDDCAAEACRQPSGKEVNWVQCDNGCELWFHLVCVGLKKSDVKKMEHYECQKCKNKKSAAAGSGSDDSSRESDSFSQSGKQSICSNKENAEVEESEEDDGGGTGNKTLEKPEVILT